MDVTLLDGGMGRRLVHRSGGAPTPLRATRVMMDHPGLVQAIHADYLAAGASIIGGCCEVGPAHIREPAHRLRRFA